MEISSTRVSVYEVVVDLHQWADSSSRDVAGFDERLLAVLPTLQAHCCMAGEEGGFRAELLAGTNFGHVIEHVLLELIRLTHPEGEGFSGWTRSLGDGQYVIHFGAPDFLTGRLAALFALEIVRMLLEGAEPDLQVYLTHLKYPLEYFSRDRGDAGSPYPSANALLTREMEYARSLREPDSCPLLTDWQQRNLVRTLGQICAALPAVKRTWQEVFLSFGGEFGRGILDKLEILNPDCFLRQLLAGNFDAYFRGVANFSHLLHSLSIPRSFVTHSAWVYKNTLLPVVMERCGADPGARETAIEDLDDFYQHVQFAIEDGYRRTSPVSDPVRRKGAKLCSFEARRVSRSLVLVVDDDAMSRQIARDLLNFNGIPTVLARDGLEALRILAENPAEIGVVLLDRRLPGIDGMAVCRRIIDGYRRVRIILSSGYPLSPEDRRILVEHEICELRKPYRSQQLTEMVRDLLDWTMVARS